MHPHDAPAPDHIPPPEAPPDAELYEAADHLMSAGTAPDDHDSGAWADLLDHDPVGETSGERPADGSPGGMPVRHDGAQLVRVIASLHGQPYPDAKSAMAELRDATVVWRVISDNAVRDGLQQLCDIVALELSVEVSGPVACDLRLIAGRNQGMLSSGAAGYLQRALDLIEAGDTDPDPGALVAAQVRAAELDEERKSAWAYVAALGQRKPEEELRTLFRKMTGPRTLSSGDTDYFGSAAEVYDRASRRKAASGSWRLSSGIPSLDIAWTNQAAGEPLGCFGPGELHVFVGDTGTGKSTIARDFAKAAAYDIRNWGLKGRVMLFHTEELAEAIIEKMGLSPGGTYADISHDITINSINASRQKLISAVYHEVARAAELGGAGDLARFLPPLCIVDYVGAIHDSDENPFNEGMKRTADLLMRGLCNWDFDAMAEFSGLSYRDAIGKPVPDGARKHNPAVIAPAQIKKSDDKDLNFEPGKSNPHKFAVHREVNGEMKPAWPLKAGDAKMLAMGDVKGSTALMDHATSVSMLHRSAPRNNEKVEKIMPDGSTRMQGLADTRARILFSKSRNGAAVPFVELQFDSAPSGRAATYYDVKAIRARDSLKLANAEGWKLGDPMLPRRHVRSALRGLY